MKNKYFLIKPDGSIVDPVGYKNSEECSREMAICIEKEAMGIGAVKKDVEAAYIKNANKLGFSWEENSGAGFINYDYKANLILRLVQDYSRHLVNSIGFPIYEVRGANFFDMKHPVVDAYASLFGDRLFYFKNEDESLVMSYDASYPQFNLAGHYKVSEKHLPFAHFSVSDCYRYEQRGECQLLLRGRRFFMPDLHPYFKDLDQAWDGYFQIEKQIEEGFKIADRKFVNVCKVSSEKYWKMYQKEIVEIAKRNNREVLVEVRMDGEERYWIIDVDYSIVDAQGQIREIGCIQIDIGNAKRLGIKYKDSDGKFNHPVIIHAAVPGGIERYIYMLIDDMEKFPIAFHPVQVRFVPVSEKFVEFAEELSLKYPDVRIDIDDRDESVAKKVKMAHEELIPNIAVVGVAEVKDLSSIEKLIEGIREKQKSLPFYGLSYPKLVSQQVR